MIKIKNFMLIFCKNSHKNSDPVAPLTYAGIFEKFLSRLYAPFAFC